MNNNDRVKILVVDDIQINRIILSEILSDTYDIVQAEDGLEALAVLASSEDKPRLLLLDIMMPGLDGFGVISHMKKDPILSKIPVIFITASDQEDKGLREGAVDYISKPFEPEIVKLRISNHIELALYREMLEQMVEEKVEELVKTKETFLVTMANLIEYRSLESGQHVKRTKELAQILVTEILSESKYAEELMSQDPISLVKAVPLHDIGKIAIPDGILLKPGKLTPDEFAVIETHTTIGGQIIESLNSDGNDVYYRHCFDICRHHHERWDGKGYPDKIAGMEIPLSARIVAVVDVYDALISERCYKKAMSHEQALGILKNSSGMQFDPEIIDVLTRVQEQFKDYECHADK